MQPNPPTQAVGMHEAWRGSALSALRPLDLLLVTDFDGTLSEIVSDPAHATIVPESLVALKRLAASLGRVVVLSSRPAADLENLVPLRDIDLIGDSGLSSPSSDERRRLDRFNVDAARLLGDVAGVWLEMKLGATAIHYRRSQATADELMGRIRPLVETTSLYALPGRRVIEVMPRERPKGDALAALIEKNRPEGVICIGDDENDRPMFKLIDGLQRPHLTVGVSSEEAPPDLFESCDLVVSGPEDVSRFLTMVADWAAQI